MNQLIIKILATRIKIIKVEGDGQKAQLLVIDICKGEYVINRYYYDKLQYKNLKCKIINFKIKTNVNEIGIIILFINSYIKQ